MSGQSSALLFGPGPQAEQGVGLFLLQKMFGQKYLPCHNFITYQADCPHPPVDLMTEICIGWLFSGTELLHLFPLPQSRSVKGGATSVYCW